jgi:hypothetical protein
MANQTSRVVWRDWQVIERIHEYKPLFGKKKVLKHYELMVGIWDDVEYQIINFYREDSEWSINHYVSADILVAYLIGACGVIQSESRAIVRKP